MNTRFDSEKRSSEQHLKATVVLPLTGEGLAKYLTCHGQRKPTMAHSIKIVLKDEKLRPDGKAPLYFRITQNRKSRYKASGVWVEPKHWDAGSQRVKNGHPNSVRTNYSLTQVLAKLNDAMLTEEEVHPFRTVFETLPLREPPKFLEYCRQYRDRLMAHGAPSMVARAKGLIGKLEVYLRGRDIELAAVNVRWLRQFEFYLLTKQGNHVNTVGANFKLLRKILNDAIADEYLEVSPFRDFTIRQEPTTTEFLDEEELIRFASVPLDEGSSMKAHRDLYVFACEAGGLRISDLLKLEWGQLKEGRIHLVIHKTKTTHVVPLSSKAQSILEGLSGPRRESDLVFGLLPPTLDRSDAFALKRALSSSTAYINRSLKAVAEMAEIPKRVTFHTSRHTFATRALRKGIQLHLVSKLLGHKSIRETERYAHIVNLDLEKAMEVFG